jgi:hypothetical protein
MIQNSDFYVNTYGLSVTEQAKSASALNDGLFYILNKNSTNTYFGGVQVVSVKFRSENAYRSTTLKISYSGSTTDDVYRYDNYILYFRGAEIGLLTINTPIKYNPSNNTVLYPFQSIEMGATYTVLNVNKINLQYYGYSKINNTKSRGIIDIALNINTYANSNQTTLLTDTMNISLNLINTGYVSTFATA